MWTASQIKDLASSHSRYPHVHPHCLTYTGPLIRDATCVISSSAPNVRFLRLAAVLVPAG